MTERGLPQIWDSTPEVTVVRVVTDEGSRIRQFLITEKAELYVMG